jgi:N-6 DNA Methylase
MTQYIGIRSEGGLIPYDILDQIAREESGLGQQAQDFGLATGRRLTDEITRAWSDAQDYWHIFERRSAGLPENETGTTLTRKWITELLNELLGYELTLQPAGAVIGGKTYPISHRAGAGEESPPIDIEGFRIDLDRRPQARRLSPQALVQEYLNNSDGHLWGIVTNGLLFRLLRDTSRTSRPSYLEFDLESIVDGNRFNEFSLFYRVCHRSRLPKTAEDSTSCWLEKYFHLSIEQGGRVRDKLRDGVEDALKSLGTGFLRHPKNDALRERVRSSVLSSHEFHRQLLRLVYRLLFLMVAEERRMIVPEAPDSERRQRLYDTYYSIGRLRTLAEKVVERSTFGDLWLSLQRTFALFENGDSNPLGIPPLNGDLFSDSAVRDLQDTHLYNDDLIAAMRRLSLFEEKRVLQRVNYGALDVEELGSVYESLLDFQPVFIDEPEGNKFDLRIGSERKSTGSYYTRPELVRELIESALVPVMQDRLASAKDADAAKEKEKKEQTILTMSVCDPACGSGHFLLAAGRKLGRELAKVRTGEEEPTPREFHLAVRDVISHCIYGVDVNPLAVDLCKLALWLEGHWTGKPLSFLDHRIKCGNSLIGVLDSSVLKEGIPDDAFTPVTGDDKKIASAYRKKNKDERKGQPSLPFDVLEHVHKFAAESEQLLGIVEDTPADVRRKEEAYRKVREQGQWLHDWTAANLWTTAFLIPLRKYDDPEVPTHSTFMDYLLHGQDRPQMTGYANALSVERHFFSWRLEFPDVFDKGGFDVVLGNPPWERIKLQEEEHWVDDPHISEAPNKAERTRRLAEYKRSGNRKLLSRLLKFENAKHVAEATGKFLRGCSRFVLTATGDINTYGLFAELASELVSATGRSGLLLPTGIVTDDNSKEFFSSIATSNRLVSVVGFINERGLFPGVLHNFKFCALTLTGISAPVSAATYSFWSFTVDEAHDPLRRFELSLTDLAIINPNTRTAPVFRTNADAELTKRLQTSVPVLVNEEMHKNPWGLEFFTMFHMANDSGLFRTKPEQDSVPLYEGKMIHQFDHRYASYESLQDGERLHMLPETSDAQHANPDYVITPCYFVPQSEVISRLTPFQKRPRQWVIGYREVTSSGLMRTVISTVMPLVAVGHKVPLLFLRDAETPLAACFVANLNSLVVDYVCKQKLGGTSLSYFVFKQLPVLSPQCYASPDLQYIVPKVLELLFTSHDMKPFADDLLREADDSLKAAIRIMGIHVPFQWASDRRFALRAELDAYFAHLYRLTRDELRYILDPKDVFGSEYPGETFRVLKDKEIKEYGEYRTRRLVLDAFDKLAESPRFRAEMSKRVSAFELPSKQPIAVH